MGLINKSKIRNYVNISVSDEVETELEKKVEELLKQAEQRAKANNRRTLMARDL